MSLQGFVNTLREQGELAEICVPVDPHLELPEIHRRVIAQGGPALLFTKVKGSRFPVVTNLFGTQKRIEIAFGGIKRLDRLVRLLQGSLDVKSLWKQRATLGSLLKIGFRSQRPSFSPLQSLQELPFTTSWPMDGGAFLTWPLVYTESHEGRGNLGIYRIQRFDDRTTGVHFQIAKGGGFHYHEAERRGERLPISILLGGPPELILAAACPLPENVPELLFASLLLDRKIPLSRVGSHREPSEVEFVLHGYASPKERCPEGPFGDHFGYYSLQHDFPVFHCEQILARKGAMFPATVVGKPRQEDYYLGNFLQELLQPLLKMAMPGVVDFWSYGETGFHSLAVARVKERFWREAMQTAFRILGEGQLSLTKFLLVTDQPVNCKDFRATLAAVLEHFDPRTDLYIFGQLSMDTLDYTGPALNKGSRGVLLGISPPRALPQEYRGSLVAKAFCPGCLVVEGMGDFRGLKEWPLVIVVDSLCETLSSEESFLWTVFTRFDPASDIIAEKSVVNNGLSFTAPIVIDARMKPSYPPVVEVDEATRLLVDERSCKGDFPVLQA